MTRRAAAPLAPGLLLGLMLGLTMALGACSSTTPSADPHSADAPTSPAPATGTVRIADVTLTPRTIDVATGGTVTWHDDDLTAHQLVSLAPNVMQSPRLEIGASYAQVFPSPGSYPYYCTIHNTMKGTVIVHRAP